MAKAGKARAVPETARAHSGRLYSATGLDDNQFEAELIRLGPSEYAKKYRIALRSVFKRRKNLETKLNRPITIPNNFQPHLTNLYRQEAFPGRLTMAVHEGVIIVAGDCHYWPGKPSLMHRALVHFIKKYRDEKLLRCVVMNGDVTDFPRLSQYPNVDWQHRPTIRDEIEVCADRLHEIEMAAGKGVERIWTLGNHDARWSMYLARHAGELEGVQGISLKDHFPNWKACMSLMVNPDKPDGVAFIKHRGPSKAERTAPTLNAEKAGYTVITNHLHSAKVIPITDMRGTRYGVDCGCIADPYGPQFLYMEDNPRNHRSAFAVLTWKGSKLMMPELVLGWSETQVQFRGEIIKP